MVEQHIQIDGKDQKQIYGILRSGKSETLVFHIHGMTHSPRHYLEVTSADFFESKNYDHYRIALYDRLPHARRLNECDIHDHAQDIQTALNHFKQSYTNIHIVAHSLGSLATLILNPKNITSCTFWDPSFDVSYFWNAGKFLTHYPDTNEYMMDYGNTFMISDKMVESLKDFPHEKCLELAKSFETNTKMILAEQSIFLASPHTNPKDYPFVSETILGSNHTFSNKENASILFQKTLEWIKKSRD